MKVLTELSFRFLPIARRILAQASNKSMKKILLIIFTLFVLGLKQKVVRLYVGAA